MAKLIRIVLAIAALVAAVALSISSPAGGVKAQLDDVSITVDTAGGPLLIADGAPQDLNAAVNTIDFNANAGGAAGFALPAGFSRADGTVQAIPAPGPAGASILRLTNFFVVRNAPGPGTYNVLFEHTFAVPAAPAIATDSIAGDCRNPIPPFVVGQCGGSWQGLVNGAGIVPPGGGQAWLLDGAPPGLDPGLVFGPLAHGPMPVAAPPWTLQGFLVVGFTAASAIGDTFHLPDSAEVVVAASIGGIFEAPNIARERAAADANGNSGLSTGDIAVIAGGLAAAAVAVAAGGWYARRRWLRREG